MSLLYYGTSLTDRFQKFSQEAKHLACIPLPTAWEPLHSQTEGPASQFRRSWQFEFECFRLGSETVQDVAELIEDLDNERSRS